MIKQTQFPLDKSDSGDNSAWNWIIFIAVVSIATIAIIISNEKPNVKKNEAQ